MTLFFFGNNDSTAATRTLKLSIEHGHCYGTLLSINSIEHFLWNSSDFFSDDVLSCLWIVVTNSVLQVPPQKIVRWVEILGIGWLRVVGLTEMSLSHGKLCLRYSSVLFEKMFWWCLISQTEHLNTSGITSQGVDSFRIKPITPAHSIPKISTHLTILWGGTWKTEFVKAIKLLQVIVKEK